MMRLSLNNWVYLSDEIHKCHLLIKDLETKLKINENNFKNDENYKDETKKQVKNEINYENLDDIELKNQLIEKLKRFI